MLNLREELIADNPEFNNHLECLKTHLLSYIPFQIRAEVFDGYKKIMLTRFKTQEHIAFEMEELALIEGYNIKFNWNGTEKTATYTCSCSSKHDYKPNKSTKIENEDLLHQ